ncbi:hypothetical protein QTP86_012756, partial [Hemibagrus guttatus]
MKVSRSKTEYMCVNEREGSGTVRLQGEEEKKVQEFKYLGSTVQSNGECGKEIKKRVQWVGYIRQQVNILSSKLEAGKMGKRKDLSEFDKGQIVMARRLDQSISKTAALVGCSRSAVVSIYQNWSKEGIVVNWLPGHVRPRLIDAHARDQCMDEPCDADDIEQTDKGFRCAIDVPSVLYKYIIGKKGETRRRLEAETKTAISIPKPGVEVPIVITGSQKAAVASAVTRVEVLIESFRRKQPFTHFLSFALNHPQIQEGFKRFKEDVLDHCSQPFRGGLAGVFWIIILLQNPSSLQLEVTNLPIYQSGKGYKAISKALGLPRTTVRAIIYKWRKHGTVENLPRSGRPTKITPRVQRQLIQEVTKDPTTTSKELQASLASVKVSVHDSTIRKRLGKNGLHGRVPRQKPLLSKKNIKARLSFARKHLDDPQDFWENTLWTDKTKIVLFGRSVSHYVCRKSNTTFQKKNIIPTVKYGGGSVMVCFAASGPGRLAVINGTMNSAVYQKILKENVRPSVCDLKLKRTWVLQQDNDPKHTSKSTSEWLKKNKMKTLEWPSQSPDLNLIEMLWHDLKKWRIKEVQGKPSMKDREAFDARKILE